MGTFAAGLELALVLLQASFHWHPWAVGRGKSLNQSVVLLLTPVLLTSHHRELAVAMPGPVGTATLNSTSCKVSKKGDECDLAWLPFQGAVLAPCDGHLPLQVPGHCLLRRDIQASGVSRGGVIPGSSHSSRPHPDLPAPSTSVHTFSQAAMASALFFFQFSGPEPLAEPGSSWPLWRQNLNRLWAEERAWTAGPRERILSGTLTRSLSQSWEAREALADSGFLLLQDTEVSVSKLLVIPFFN